MVGGDNTCGAQTQQGSCNMWCQVLMDIYRPVWKEEAYKVIIISGDGGCQNVEVANVFGGPISDH